MRDQKSILEHRIRKEINIDIRYQSWHPLVVSEYETREAAVFCNYTWDEFNEILTAQERAICVAHFRMKGIIEANVNEIVSDYRKQLEKRHSGR